jgi:outer membrane lipoprotein SlyB
MRKQSFLFTLIVAAAGVTLSADKVTLRSGQVVSGNFMSADVKIVRVLLANGRIAEFPVDTVSALEFTPRKTPPAVAPDPAVAPKPITIPNGTVLNVLLSEAIDVDAAQAGHTFKSLLDDPVMMNGKVIIPRGSAVVLQAAKVEQAGKMKGADKITLKANSLSFGGRKYDIVTTPVEQKGAGEGKKTTRKLIGGAGLGAIVGGIAGGGKGAAIGAAIGAGAGAASTYIQGSNKVKLESGTEILIRTAR